MEPIPEKIDSKFRYVLLAAHRAEQLILGAPTKLAKQIKSTTNAMQEIQDELVEWDYGPRQDAEADETGSGS